MTSSDDLRLTRIEQSLIMLIEVMTIHGAKLDAIMEAATKETGPSETALMLKKVVEGQEHMNELLQDLSANIGVVFRDELDRADAEAEPEPHGG